MTKNQYENIVETTIKNEPADKGGLDTVRDILKNLGIGFPKGDVKEIRAALETEDFMGWRTCSTEEAKESISNGTPVIGISSRGVSVIVDPEDISGSGYDVLYSYNGETTCGDVPEFQTGTYFINNKKTGKYLYSTSSAIDGRSGTFSSLGNNIRWKLLLSEDNSYYIIYPINNVQKCLAVTTSGVALVNRTSSPTDFMKWEIAYKPGGGSGLFSIRNRGNSNYLKYGNNSFGTSNNYEDEYIGWRIASVSQSVINSELNSSFKFNDLVFDVGESRYPEISEGSYGVLWAHLDDFEYSFGQSFSEFLTFNSSQLFFTGLGRCPAITISATHKVTNITVMFEVLIYSNIDNLAEMLGQLYDLAVSYSESHECNQFFELCCNYIRRVEYNSGNFNTVAGNINTGFVDYVHTHSPEVEQYFMCYGPVDKDHLIFVNDTASDNEIDIVHMFYVLNRLFYSRLDLGQLIYTDQQLDDLSGWAGDLQSLIKQYYTKQYNLENTTYQQIYNKFLSMLGSSDFHFSMSDLYADIDAENLGQLIHSMDEYNGDNLASSILNYYSVEHNHPSCRNRVSIWRNQYSDEEFEELVMSFCQTNIPILGIPHLLFIISYIPLSTINISDTEKEAFADAFIFFINNLAQNEM